MSASLSTFYLSCASDHVKLSENRFCSRQRLRDNWGIVDVDDCANAAQHLAKQGKVDGQRLTIDGGSAGGKQHQIMLSYNDTALLLSHTVRS